MTNENAQYKLGIITPSFLVPGYMTYIDRQVVGLNKCSKRIMTLDCGVDESTCHHDIVVLPSESLIFRTIDKMNWYIKKKLLHEEYWTNTDISASKRLSISLKESQFDIILVHFFGIAISFLSILKAINVPICIYCHESEVEQYLKYKKYKQKLDILFKLGHIFFCPSQFIKEVIVKAGCPEIKTKVLYLGIDLPRTNYPRNINKKIKFISTGRLVPIKNYEMMINAFINLNPENAELKIIGEGPLKGHLRTISENSNTIKIPGSMPNNRVYKELLNSDVYLQSSDNESLGVSILEAMACGLPVIATDVGGVSEVVRHGETGFLVKKNGVNDMEKYITILCKDHNLRLKLGRAGRLRAEKYFNCIKQNSLLDDLLMHSANKSK